MCNLNALQQNIAGITKDGYDIALFLADAMRGETPGVKVCHRMEAAKHLIRYGFTDADCETTSNRLSRAGGNPVEQGEGTNTPSPSTGEGWDGGEDSSSSMSASISHLDILNYQIAHLIRHETADGHTIVNFLVDIMTGRDRPFTPKKFRIKPADRMAAARELLRRGFGDLGSRRKPSDITDEANAYDTLHTDLAKRMREYSERGTDTVRFLLEVMSDPDPDLEFTIHHRMSAAQELLRRGWDTNYDAVKSKHLQAYWQDKESPRLSVCQKKTLAGLSTSIDDYDNYDDTDYAAIAKEMREDEDREAASKSRHSRAGGNPEGQGEAANNPPLPQGDGWGEGSAGIQKTPSPVEGEGWDGGEKSPTSKSDNTLSTPILPQSKSENEPTDRKAIIKEFREAMNRGDERAALRAEAKYRRIDVKPEKNIYDYGPNDPDPTIDYYFEPLNSEEQAKFDKEDRREYGLTEVEIADYSSMPAPRGMSDPLVQLAEAAEAAEAHNTPILPNPLSPQAQKPHHPQPLKSPSFWERAKGEGNEKVPRHRAQPAACASICGSGSTMAQKSVRAGCEGVLWAAAQMAA